MWGDRDFWAITGQKKWQWDDKIVGEPNPGDSWCICMWAFANMIEEVGGQEELERSMEFVMWAAMIEFIIADQTPEIRNMNEL